MKIKVVFVLINDFIIIVLHFSNQTLPMVKTTDFVEYIKDLIADSKKIENAIKAMLVSLKGNKGYFAIAKLQ